MTLTTWICLLVSSFLMAQQDLELKLKGSANADSPAQARSKIQTQLTEQATSMALQQVLSEKKIADSKAPLKAVQRQSAKFIPYFKAGELQTTASGYEMEAVLRVSIKDLKQLLSKAGLLSEKESGWTVVPLIKFSDKINSSQYVWWSQGETIPTVAVRAANRLEASMREKFLAQGFFALRPVQTDLSLMLGPGQYPPVMNWDKQQQLAQQVGADLVVTGEVDILAHQQYRKGAIVAVHLTGTHRGTGRVVGEVARQIPVDNLALGLTRNANFFDEVVSDLTTQVFEGWKKGTLGADLILVKLEGHFKPKDLSDLRNWILEKVPQVKTMRERKFEMGSVVFEADVTAPVNEIAAALNTPQSDKPSFRVSHTGSKEIELQWVSKR